MWISAKYDTPRRLGIARPISETVTCHFLTKLAICKRFGADGTLSSADRAYSGSGANITRPAMMDKCPDSYLSKSCSKVVTSTGRSWCYAFGGI